MPFWRKIKRERIWKIHVQEERRKEDAGWKGHILADGERYSKKNFLSSTLISTYRVRNKYCKIVEVVEFLRSYTTTQSHWSSGSTIFFLLRGAAVRALGVHPHLH
jgi:hypothetical protein